MTPFVLLFVAVAAIAFGPFKLLLNHSVVLVAALVSNIVCKELEYIKSMQIYNQNYANYTRK